MPVTSSIQAQLPVGPDPLQSSGATYEAIRLGGALSRQWPLLLVLAAFLGAALWVPVMTPVATTDDWGYTRSVEIVLEQGRLEVFPVVAATAVFQIVWGALFALFTENTLGAVRVSTVVIAGLGGVALYDLCRQLGVSTARSALGAAIYLFNPLAFVLSYTFMTDPQFAAVMLIATACTVRAIEPDRSLSMRWLVAGSVAASAAILIRQQGVLIPLATALFFILRRDPVWSKEALRRLCAVLLVPAVTTLLYIAWLRWVNGVPDVQSEFATEISGAGIAGTARLVSSLTYFEMMYAGLFVLPVTAAAVIGLPALIRGVRGYLWLLVVGWAAVACAGLGYFAGSNRRMPYVPQFMGPGGLGPPDVRGSRPRLFEPPFFDVLTAVSFVCTIILAVIFANALSTRMQELRGGPGLVVAVLLGQVAGVIPPSYHYLSRGYSLDRYLLPLLPLIVALALWALNRSRLTAPIGWAVVALFGAFAVAGTRDYLHYLDTTWDLAAHAIESGARPDQVDAGAAWDGYHLYSYAVEQGITRARTRDGP